MIIKLGQKGSTLVMSILILSAVVSTSILVGGIVFRELKLSNTSADSLNAYYASETGAEMALFRKLRAFGTSIPKSGRLDNSESSWSIVVSEGSSEISGILGQHQTKEVPLYSVGSDEPLANLGSAEVLFNGGGIMQWSLYSWDESKPVSFITRGTDIDRGALDSGTCVPRGDWACSIRLDSSDLDSSQKHVLRFRPFCKPGNLCSGNWDYQFYAYSSSMPPPNPGDAGLLVDVPIGFQVTSSGKSKAGKFNRFMEATIPLRGPVFGIFDYGIFSDKDLEQR